MLSEIHVQVEGSPAPTSVSVSKRPDFKTARWLSLQSLLQAHDSIAEKEMEPEPLPAQGETLTQWGGETVKIVRIEKAKDIPLVTAARSNLLPAQALIRIAYLFFIAPVV